MLSLLKKTLRKLTKQKLPVWFLEDFQTLQNQEQASTSRFRMSEANLYPCLSDRSATTLFDRYSIYHPAWAAQVLAQTKPVKHVDISSTLHFSTMLAAFIPTEFYDYRPTDLVLKNYYTANAYLTQLLFESNPILLCRVCIP